MVRMPLVVLALAVLASGAAAKEPAVEALPMAAGMAAKLACSGVFVSNRPLADVVSKDIERLTPLARGINYNLDSERSTITATKGGVTRTALYRPGLGCTLAVDTDLQTLRQQAPGVVPMTPASPQALWPLGDEVESGRVAPDIDEPALRRAVDAAFADDTPDQAIDTRALLVVYDGRIVAERYAPGFSKDTRFLGWSASNSVLATLVGALITDGKLRLEDPAPIAEWRGDARREITIANLLQMSSGLAFSEPYVPGSDSMTMLFLKGDMAGFAAAKPLQNKPGAQWYYASGTANILARVVLQAAGGSLPAATNYARQRLFEPAGMTSAVFEPDAKGAFVGSSYFYATARDWARFGLLYLDGGTINGRRLLAPSFVSYVQRPAPASPRADYGAQFWLNGFEPNSKLRQFPSLPEDTYMARGHNRQTIAVFPSRKAVIVRLGWTVDGYDFDTNKHFAAILAALHPARPRARQTRRAL
jgi:CubicO group peptidase (beta-lactamase class C family)